MKNKWQFFGLFLLYALVLSIIWFKLHQAYLYIPAAIADIVLHLFGYSGDIVEIAAREGKHYIRFPDYAPRSAFTGTNMVFNVVPFLALVLATPRVTLKKMLLVAGYGLLILLALHVLSIIAMFFRAATQFPWKDAVYYVFPTLLEPLSSIILWLVFLGRDFIFSRR